VFAYYLQASRPESLDRLRFVLDSVAPSEPVVASPHPAPLGWRGTWVLLESADADVWRRWLAAHRPSTIVIDGSDQHVRVAKAAAEKVAWLATPEFLLAPDGAEPTDADPDLILAPWPAGDGDGWPSAWQERLLPLGAFGWAARAAVRRRTSRVAKSEDRWSCVRLVPTAAGPLPRERRDLADETPGWQWWIANERDVLCDGPTFDHLLRADVVVCAPTLANLAAVAAVQVPALLVTAERPSASESFLADRARQTAPVVVLPESSAGHRWRIALTEARELDGAAWAAWDPEPALDRLREAFGSPRPDATVPHQRAGMSGVASL
jgi:hypothetical protein